MRGVAIERGIILLGLVQCQTLVSEAVRVIPGRPESLYRKESLMVADSPQFSHSVGQ